MSVTLNPPYEEWRAILASNSLLASSIHSVLGAEFVARLRREIGEVTVRYRAEMEGLAHRLGISLSQSDTGNPMSGGAIVMAGHQPVVYHPGIIEKTKRLGALATETGSRAVNVAIDTDEGDGGRLIWPLRDGDDVVIKQRSIATASSLYRDQRVVPKGEVGEVFAEMKRDLQRSGCASAVSGAERAGRLYSAMEGESIVLANALVRKALREGGYDEVPLSLLLEAPSVREFINRIVDDAERFVALYNTTLERYRVEHKIKNPANPFPNMTVTSEDIELPLWEVVGSCRKGVVAHRKEKIKSTGLLAPRGSIVTLLLRGACSDLFIHGIGGGKYDQFVNSFAESYWGSPLPRFVVATATEYLFPERVQEYLHARKLKAKYKEMVSHTDGFLGKGVFSEQDEKTLRTLLERRATLLPRIQAFQPKEERSAVAHELNQVNRLIKSAIDASSIAPLLAQGRIDDARLNRWACREYPFFLFQK